MRGPVLRDGQVSDKPKLMRKAVGLQLCSVS